jgi:argininosuccinate lyase
MTNKMWGGRFASGPSEIMEEINASIGYDKRLYNQDITGSIAHAEMLADAGILSKSDCKKIINGLKQIKQEIESDQYTFSRQ